MYRQAMRLKSVRILFVGLTLTLSAELLGQTLAAPP
jgi:hypothetical protein